jgi:hypothetical protein
VAEVGAEKGFGLGVALAGGPAGAYGYELAGVFVGFGAVEVGLGWGGGRSAQEEEE